MNLNALLESMSSFKANVPMEANILELRRSPVDELQRRLRKWLKIGGEACEKDFDRGQWTTYEDRTVVRLPQSALAVVYHASGAVKLTTGLAPMEHLFKDMESKAQLTERTERALKSFGVQESLGRGETLSFERLWQMKAAGEDRFGKIAYPVLCRAVGAFRHYVEGLPVLGPASVAVQLAGEGVIDSVSILMRNPAEVLERAKVLHPERALRQIGQELSARFPQTDGKVQVESREGLRFGYLSLPKRKAQRVLAPVYVAMFEVAHEQERQAFVMAVSATERSYLPLDTPGSESLVIPVSKIGSRRNC